MEDEAVSPVIGVILMVAITVVVAAVVFFVSSSLGETTEQAPNVSFRKDSSDRSLTVVTASPGALWIQDLDLGGSCAATATLNGEAWPPADGTLVRGGDVIAGCVSGDTLQVIATKPNQLVYQTTFA